MEDPVSNAGADRRSPGARGRRLAAWIAGLIAFCGLVRLLQPAGTQLDGRPVEVWVAESIERKPDAEERVLGAGAFAAPALGAELVAREPLSSRFSRWILPHCPAVLRLHLPAIVDAEANRRVAASLISRLGTNALPALPHLFRALDDPSEYVRVPVASLLGSLGTNALPAVPRLLEMAGDTNAFVAMNTLPALGRLRANPGAAVPLLVRQLRSPDAGVRMAAAVAVSNYGPLASGAAEGLRALLEDPDPNLRGQALQAAGRIGVSDPGFVTSVTRALDDTELPNQIFALQALGSMGTAARPAVPRIVHAMRNNVGGLWRFGRAALLQIAPETPEAREQLLEQ